MDGDSLERFYSSIIDQEIKRTRVKESKLSSAIQAIRDSYSQISLKIGQTYIDYNEPPNRCAYLYRFAILHTALVMRYFETLLLNPPSVALTLSNKPSIKICCLGGGPGTDFVAICKVLAKYKNFYGKIEKITILDICGGWRNSFKEIISSLKAGKVEDVPANFLDATKFQAALKQVNLLEELPSSIAKIISDADIVCMVKFVSAIVGKPESQNALKGILSSVKLDAAVLYVDNCKEQSYDCMKQIYRHCGLKTVLGPVHELYQRNCKISKEHKKLYSKHPLDTIRVTVIGWIKNVSSETFLSINPLENISVDEDSWETDSDSDFEKITENSISKNTKSSIQASSRVNLGKLILPSKPKANKSTQTERVLDPNSLKNDSETPLDLHQVVGLLKSLDKLLLTLNKLDANKVPSQSCGTSHQRRKRRGKTIVQSLLDPSVSLGNVQQELAQVISTILTSSLSLND